ncbi:riboflavin synthase [Aciduricibacillus chroicocephali]|uniref:Riboflavin synthase n=1 Tax=Aciduricibacillus chroicocephali TaxID=3054939 RepID=A0ABY9KX85_9BACI|nr:riboflavin synthase [Bacillaceae bacterium 44XB]
MFTGIIEEKGVVRRLVQRSAHAYEIEIGAKRIMEDISLGDSIAINGVCLTVTAFDQASFKADIMPETYHATNLAKLISGSEVNLERAMSANGRFGGHFVSGHVDGTAKILDKQPLENAIIFNISIPDGFAKYFLRKGSVAVDGISLTLFHVDPDSFSISIIPHTAAETTLGSKRKGDIVNIECDMLAKHVWQMTDRQHSQESDSTITRQNLAAAGFLEGGL